MRTILIYQAQENSCGYACVKMMLANLSKDRRWSYLDEPDAREKPSLYDLIEWARFYGLQLNAYRSEPQEIQDNEKFPLILLLHKEGRLHCVYLARRRRKRYLILDPESGKRWLSEKELIGCWSGYFLEVEDYQKIVPPCKDPDLYQGSYRLLVDYLLAGTFASSIDAGVTANLSLPSYVPIIHACKAALYLLAYVFVLFAVLKKFDQRFEGALIGLEKEERKRHFSLYQKYRALYYGAENRLIASLGFSATLAIIFSFSDAILGITLAIALALVFASRISDVPEAKRMERRLALLESSYYEETDSSKLSLTLSRVHRLSSKLGGYYLIRRACFLVISMGLAFLSLSLSGGLNFASFASYAFAISSFSISIDAGLSDLGLMKEKKRLESAFARLFSPTDATRARNKRKKEVR